MFNDYEDVLPKSDQQKPKEVHLDQGTEAHSLTISGMVDSFITLTDQLTKVRKAHEILRQQILDKSRGWGVKKGELGSICISEGHSQTLDVRKIRIKMGATWIEEFSKPVSYFPKVQIVSRSPEYFEKMFK